MFYMANIAYRRKRKNSSGSYDTVYYETDSRIVMRPNGESVETALNKTILSSEKNQPNGVAALDETGKIYNEQLPKISNINKKSARFIVGTSKSGWTADDCDYLCDGTDDQVEINAAIQALSENGGEVIILDGTYNITGIIEVNKVNTKLSGNGKSTILKRMWKSSREGVIKVSKNYCTIANLQIDGNDSVYSYGYGIHIVGIFFNLIVTDITITGVICNNNNTGIVAEQISNSIVSGNVCCNNANTGIEIAGSETNLPSNNVIVTNNICNNNEVWGIKLYACDKSTVTSNICNDNDTNIIIGESNNNTITGNTCIRGSGLPSDYTTTQCTIDCTGNNNLIVGNNIMGKNYTDSGTGNTWDNNKYQ